MSTVIQVHCYTGPLLYRSTVIQVLCVMHLHVSSEWSACPRGLLGSGGLMVRAPACRSRGRWFDSTSAVSFTPLCPCLSEETLKAVGPNSCVSSRLGCLEYNYLRLERHIMCRECVCACVSNPVSVRCSGMDRSQDISLVNVSLE